MKLNLKYLTPDRQNGITRYYVRKTGHPKIRLKAAPGSATFFMEYNAAMLKLETQNEKIPSKYGIGSLGRLINQYQDSPEFERLAKNTRKERLNVLNRVTRAYGHQAAAMITAADIYALRDAHKDTPAAANKFVKCLRYVYNWNGRLDPSEHNPAANVKLFSQTGDGFAAWTEVDVRAFLKQHKLGSKAYLAFMIHACTGARRSDACRIGPPHIISNNLVWHPTKTPDLTITSPMIPMLEDAIQKARTGDLTFLVTDYGLPFSAAGYGTRFKKWCVEAGIQGKNTHGIRKALGGWLADLGATENELMAILGHTTHQQVTKYTKSAKSAGLAASGMSKYYDHLSRMVVGGTN